MAAVFGIGLIVALFILFFVINDGEYDDDYSSSNSETSYQHENYWGVPGGKTHVKNDKMEHTDFFGVPTGYSEKSGGDRIQHKTWYGDYNGYSTQNGSRIEHYSDFGVYKGYSEKHSDGTITHHDIFGIETSRSRKN